MPLAYIGIGSNLGNRGKNCLDAVESLRQSGVEVTKLSSLYETEPWGIEQQPEFINMAVEAETSLSPGELLKTLKKIEKAMGRSKALKWGPRLIDLDILLYDNRQIDYRNLKIPHPLMHKRKFVLEPLAEIAPDAVHPVLSKTIRILLWELTGV